MTGTGRSAPAVPDGGLWAVRRHRERWPALRAVDRALRDHVDPGPDHRSATVRAARLEADRPTTALVMAAVLVGGIVVACVGTAVVREDIGVALAAVPLVLATASAAGWQRRSRSRALRWLADPPYPQEERP